MLESSLHLGSIAGIRIGVHYTWFVIFILLTSSLYAVFQMSYEDWGSAITLLTAVTTSLLFFGSIVLHELGHSLVAISRGIPVRSITLFIFGGVAQSEKDADSAATEFWIAIAGPAVSFVLAGLFYLLSLLVQAYSEPVNLAFSWLAQINLIVALFNLLPGFPLDGGRVFRAIVWGITGNARLGMHWAVTAGKTVAYSLIVLGMLIALRTGLLLNGIWVAVIGWFLLTAAEASARAYDIGQYLGKVVARDVMQREIPTVPASLSLVDWIDNYVLTTGQRGFLVTDGDNLVGLLTLRDATKFVRVEWAGKTVRDVMTPIQKLHTVLPNTPVTEALTLMQHHGYNQIPVAQDGRIVGWIDRAHLLQIMQLHSEIGR